MVRCPARQQRTDYPRGTASCWQALGSNYGNAHALFLVPFTRLDNPANARQPTPNRLPWSATWPRLAIE